MPFFKVAGPNEAIFVSGSFQREPKVVVGGRCFVWPIIQKKPKAVPGITHFGSYLTKGLYVFRSSCGGHRCSPN